MGMAKENWELKNWDKLKVYDLTKIGRAHV